MRYLDSACFGRGDLFVGGNSGIVVGASGFTVAVCSTSLDRQGLYMVYRACRHHRRLIKGKTISLFTYLVLLPESRELVRGRL